MDDGDAVLPGDALRGVRLRARDRPLSADDGAGRAAYDRPRGRLRVASDHSGRNVEGARCRRSDRRDLRTARGDGWPALLRPLCDWTAPPGVVPRVEIG